IGLVTAIVVRAALAKTRPPPAPRFRTASASAGEAGGWMQRFQGRTGAFEVRLGRFFFEYVGNMSLLARGNGVLFQNEAPVERRINHRARMLLDWIKGQMEERGFPKRDGEEFLNDLREVIRQEGSPASATASGDPR